MVDADVSLQRHFFSEFDSSSLFSALRAETPWREVEISIWGKRVVQPRLIAWYGDPGASYKYSGTRFQPLAWTSTLSKIRDRLQSELGVAFNSVLLNLYRNQSDSMGWHSDDEKELGLKPTIASISLGTTRDFLFKHKVRKDLKQVKLPLTSGSLLVMSGDTQQFWVHSIMKQTARLGERINLTFRLIR